MPVVTANNGAGIVSILFANGCCIISIAAKEKNVTITELNVMWRESSLIFPRKLVEENKSKNPLVQKSGRSYPNTKGICFEIKIIPIAANIPFITDEGKKFAIVPNFKIPSSIWKNPATITVNKKIL